MVGQMGVGWVGVWVFGWLKDVVEVGHVLGVLEQR